MYTPTKPVNKILNSSCTPYSLASSKVSTNCDFQKSQQRSNSKKKFTRKRQNSSDSLKRFRVFQTQKKLKRVQNAQVQENIQQSVKKADELLQKLSIKRQQICSSKYVRLSTQRSSKQMDESSLNGSFAITSRIRVSDRNKTQYQQLNTSINSYKMELQIRNNQFMVVEDENVRLKKELKNRQSQLNRLAKQKEQIRVEYQMKIKALNQKINKLEPAILSKTQLLEKTEKVNSKLKQQLKKSQNQIQLLKIHIDQIMTKKIPKNALEIISYREESLQNQINELKKELSFSKSQRILQMEHQLDQMKQKMHNTNQENSSLSVANRILIKKTQSVDGSIQKKHKGEVSQLKQKMKTLVKQSSLLKKQNVSLRKSLHEYQRKYQKSPLSLKVTQKRQSRCQSSSKKVLQINDENVSDDSFSFSLSR